MSTVQVEEFRLRDRLHLPPTEADEFVDFWRAGAEATGLFSCVECGSTVRSVRRLPSCPTCGSRLWEEATTSPYRAQATTAAEASSPGDVESVAGAFQAFLLGLTVGPVLWLVVAGTAFGAVKLAS